jgi:hypothetical protein
MALSRDVEESGCFPGYASLYDELKLQGWVLVMLRIRALVHLLQFWPDLEGWVGFWHGCGVQVLDCRFCMCSLACVLWLQAA